MSRSAYLEKVRSLDSKDVEDWIDDAFEIKRLVGLALLTTKD